LVLAALAGTMSLRSRRRRLVANSDGSRGPDVS
jgi:hypothetical protein